MSPLFAHRLVGIASIELGDFWILRKFTRDQVQRTRGGPHHQKATERFISLCGAETADTRSGVAGDAQLISEVVVGGLAQSRDQRHRAALLEALDALLELGAYELDDAIADAER